MKIHQRTLLCVVLNCASLVPVFIFVGIYAKWEFGPTKNLRVISVPINTWSRYIVLLLMSSLLKILEVGLNDVGSPNLGFTIYDPTKTKVFGFTRWQLEIEANAMWLSNNIGTIFKTMILVSRLDIALISTFCGEIAGMFVVHYLLNQKKDFIPQYDTKDEWESYCLQGESVELI